MLILGIDEAGRGPILGPMVMAGVILTPSQAGVLTRAGVADSKRFGVGGKAHAARLALVPTILRVATATCIRVLTVAEINRHTEQGLLNALERLHAGVIIRKLGDVTRIVCDGQRLFGPLRQQYPHLEAVDHGEDEHAAVAAASVLAKVRRDELFDCIARRYRADFGEITGGGYVNAATRRFLAAYRARHGALPPEARRSWQTRDADQLSLLPSAP